MIRPQHLLFPILFSFSLSAQTFYKGGDLSFVNELEDCGVVWKLNNVSKDIFTIFKDHDANIVRIRIWHTPLAQSSPSPPRPPSDKSGYRDTESLISRAKAAGFKVMLNFHYSDTWTDPSHQKCPAAWINVVNNPTVLADSLYRYTKFILNSLKAKNLSPDFVQVGNETNGGMCFGGDGAVTWPTDWNKQKQLYNAGIKAVREVLPSTKIILHVADPQHVEWWVGELRNNGVTDFDIVGISYYPIIHTSKTINDVGTIIGNVKKTFNKDAMIVETALPWTDGWDDNTTNMMNGVPSGYGSSASPEIQAKWLTDLSNKVQSSGGLGVVYWAPEWVASHKSGCVRDFGGSTWENMTFFDFNNNIMNNGGIKFIGTPTAVHENKLSVKTMRFSISVQHNVINFHSKTTHLSKVQITILTLQGKQLIAHVSDIAPGDNVLCFTTTDLIRDSGTYIAKIQYLGNTSYVKFNTIM